ncbi:MAG TPA: NAD(P)H-binding protein [Actinomycetales bacterium]|nr:NAD(P)H-binding protein [Actinomycetales bacterium]
MTTDPQRVLVTGATGFIGSRLARSLDAEDHEVRAMTRRPEQYSGPGRAVLGDVHVEPSLATALGGCAAAYYLVHSLGRNDFERLDAEAAMAFGTAAADAGLRQIVYLGGLGRDDETLSAHLRSRRDVEGLLGCGGVPVTTLRAGIIIGSGGISWEMTRQLVEHLPAMVTPRWVATRTQPVAVADAVRYLAGVLLEDAALDRTFEIGGPEVVSYAGLLKRVAAIEGKRLPILSLPLLSPGLSSRWLGLITDVDAATGRTLIDSMTNEVVVNDDAIRDVVPFEPTGLDDAVRAALDEAAGKGGR